MLTEILIRLHDGKLVGVDCQEDVTLLRPDGTASTRTERWRGTPEEAKKRLDLKCKAALESILSGGVTKIERFAAE